MLEKNEVERLRKCAVEQPLVRPWIEVCDDWLTMTDRRTWFEVDVVVGSMPPGLIPMQVSHVEKFDSEADAVEWADRFRDFLGTQKRYPSRGRLVIEPTDEEIEFLGGDHCAVEFGGITERTERKVLPHASLVTAGASGA